MFVCNGINHFAVFKSMTQYATMMGFLSLQMRKGMTGLMLLLGGLSIVLGIYPFVSIVLLVAFLVPVSLMMHNFWKLEDPQLRMSDKINIMKNMALLGAILMLLAIPTPWPLSLVP